MANTGRTRSSGSSRSSKSSTSKKSARSTRSSGSRSTSRKTTAPVQTESGASSLFKKFASSNKQATNKVPDRNNTMTNASIW